MEKTNAIGCAEAERPLTPSPRALRKALRNAAHDANRLAAAFGVKVPVATLRRTATP